VTARWSGARQRPSTRAIPNTDAITDINNRQIQKTTKTAKTNTNKKTSQQSKYQARHEIKTVIKYIASD
jgi:hypothetical protein